MGGRAKRLISLFRDEEIEGPRVVADVEIVGDYRAIGKLAVYTRVSEFLAAVSAD